MSLQLRSFSSPRLVLAIILAILGIGGNAKSAVADASGWKIPADPEIVSFKRADADVVTQALVAPPFLSEHEQVADGPPRLVKIRMDIVERELEIAPGVFVWQMAFNNSVPGPVPVVH